MKRNLFFILVVLAFQMGTQIAVNAQDLSVSDVQDSGCQRGTRSRANENETKRTIVLTKEGTILTVQILGFVSNCATMGFDITPNMSGGSDGEPVSVSLGVEPIEPDVASICICPFNVSFTLHGLETNSFYFTCWWYEGQVSLTEGEPLTLESITEPVHVGEWYYTIDKVNHTAIVRGVDGETDDLTIPWFTYYEGEDYFVTGIDEAAFLNDKTLSSVNIPTNLTHIGYYAFAYCSNLKDVYCFADQVPTTGSDVFQGTPIASATLHVPAGLIDKYKATAPWNEFGNIVGEGEVTIDGLNYYLNSSFYRAPLIKGNNWEGELDIPSEVSFYGQTYTVTCIAQAAFFDNSKLTKVRIPKSIEYIIRGYYTTNPYEDVPTGLVSPDHMNPFRGCTALESIEVEEENPGLKSVDGVLFSQDGRGYYYYQTNSYYGTGLYCYPAGARRESYTIPNGVEWIGSGAFEDNQYISTLTIPSSMKMMYYSVFAGCSNLKDIYCNAENVPVAFSFEDFPISSATLHVPAGSVEKYKAASPWSEFGSIVAIEPQNGAFLSEGMAWVDGFGYEQDGHYKTDDVKLFYYITVGDTLIDDKSYFRIQRIKTCKTKTYEESKYEVFDDNLCFFMREDDAGDVWLYAKDRDVFYRLSGNTLYDYLADDLVGRDLFLFNAKKKYAVGDKLPLGMSALVDQDGFHESEDYWHIYSLDVEDVSERNLLDGKTYPIYNNYFLESIGPLDGPLSGIGSPNSYSLDFRHFFAFYRDGQLLYKNEGYIAALEDFFPNILDIITGSSPAEIVTFTENQMATIILPTEPDASKGKYYRLDRCEDGQIIFEQELHPQAHIPYIIVPSEDFSIETGTLDLAGLRPDTVSIAGIHFIGTYTSKVLPSLGGDGGGSYYDIIDTTPDCQAEEGKAYTIGALRAYLTVNWDDPINHSGSKGPGDKLEIVLKDYGTSIGLTPTLSKGEGVIYDLSGRRLSGKPAKGVYIKEGKKFIAQ